MKREIKLGNFMGDDIFLRTESDMTDTAIIKNWENQKRMDAEILKSKLLFKLLDKEMQESERMGFWDIVWGKYEFSRKIINRFFNKLI